MHAVTLIRQRDRVQPFTLFRHGAASNLQRAPRLKQPASGETACPQKIGPGRCMQCFKRQRLSLEQDTAIEHDTPDPTDSDDLNCDQELADFLALPHEEPNSEEVELHLNNLPADLFDYFFKVQAERAREAFILNGN